MTVLGIFLNKELRTGGHRRYLELLEGMAARGNRVVVIMNADLPYAPAHFQDVRLSAPYIHRGFPPVALRFLSAIKRNMARIRSAVGSVPDCVLVHGETHFPAALAARHAFEAPLIFGHRSNMVQESLLLRKESQGGIRARAHAFWELEKYKWYERILARRTDLIVFQSEYDRKDFCGRTRLEPGRSAVVYGNIGVPRFNKEQEGANRGGKLRRVVYIGNYSLRKGARYLVEAAAILARRGLNDIVCELIGPGEERTDLERRVRELGLTEVVKLRGHVPDPFPFLVAADLLVVPSLFDSFPDTVLEALHVGIPVIASRVGGIPEILIHDELLFPPADSEAIADRIERCANDNDFYLRLRMLCSKRAEAFHFDWPAAWEQAIYRRIQARMPISRREQ